MGAANDAIRAVTYVDEELPVDSVLHCASVTLDTADAMLTEAIGGGEAGA